VGWWVRKQCLESWEPEGIPRAVHRQGWGTVCFHSSQLDQHVPCLVPLVEDDHYLLTPAHLPYSLLTFFLFLAALKFELRSSLLQNRQSTA
jgi:hypothetical protein